LLNILRNIENNTSPAIVDLEDLGCLSSTGKLKKHYKELFDKLHIDIDWET
jgi:hypothetical protein